MENQHHTREGTSLSLTGTLVNRQDGSGRLLSTVFSDPTITSTCPQQSPDNLTTDPRTATTTPPSRHTKHRTLVLCFDGTGEQFNTDNSNVVQLVSLLKKDDNSQQVVYYQVRVIRESYRAVVHAL
jgi:Uncharacterized alpha/beta hydrolase domain (DUF2235)